MKRKQTHIRDSYIRYEEKTNMHYGIVIYGMKRKQTHIIDSYIWYEEKTNTH